jgi:hypothetical protein
MVVEHGVRAGGTRRQQGHSRLAGRWFSTAGGGGGTVEVRVLIFRG